MIMLPLKNNETMPMTRRYPDLPHKKLKKDSDILKKMMYAWDVEQNKPKVLEIYLKECSQLSDERYWEIMRTVWVICGSLENVQTFRKLMTSSRKQKFYFSTPEEAKRLRELPDQIDVYRATNDRMDLGISWTLSRAYAEQYQQMFMKSTIVHKTINKSSVFALIERNREEEIIIL